MSKKCKILPSYSTKKSGFCGRMMCQFRHKLGCAERDLKKELREAERRVESLVAEA